MRKRIDGNHYGRYDGGRSRFVRLSQIQAGPTALGSTPTAAPQQAPATPATPATPEQQNVLDNRNLDQYRKTLANLETQVTEYKRMITELEQRIIMRGQGKAV